MKYKNCNNDTCTTQFITPLNGKPTVGYCVDDDGKAWVNIDLFGNREMTFLNASFDGCPVAKIGNSLFVGDGWAKRELVEQFAHDNKALNIINAFFLSIEQSKQQIAGVSHAIN